VKTKLTKLEKKEPVYDVYAQWFKEVLPKCQENFDQYNKSLNFIEKVEKLHDTIRSAEHTDKIAW
jgi:hypothetical protein